MKQNCNFSDAIGNTAATSTTCIITITDTNNGDAPRKTFSKMGIFSPLIPYWLGSTRNISTRIQLI